MPHLNRIGVIFDNTSSTISPQGLIYKSPRIGGKTDNYFTCCSFESREQSVTCVSKRGEVYQFRMGENRYSLAHRVGIWATQCECLNQRKGECVVGFRDGSVRVVDQSHVLGTMNRAHEKSVCRVHRQKSGRLFLTCSKDAVNIYDLVTFKKVKVLNSKNKQLDDAQFSPQSSDIVTCLSNEVFIWSMEKYDFKARLSMPPNENNVLVKVNTFTISVDEHWLVTGGKCPYISFWDYKTRKLVGIISLPSVTYGTQKMKLSPKNDLLFLLTTEGKVMCIELSKYEVIFELQMGIFYVTDFDLNDECSTISVTTSGGSLLLYDVSTIISHQTRNRHLKELADQESFRIYLNSVNFSETKTKSQIPNVKFQEPSIPLLPVKKINEKKWTSSHVSAVPQDIRDEMAKESKAFSNLTPQQINFSFDKLKKLLLQYGEYPPKYRTLIWRFILCLPENNTVFDHLVKQGSHIIVYDLHDRYPIPDSQVFRRLEKILSALAHYSPAYASTEMIPECVYPFLNIYNHDLISIFETVVTFFTNWGKDWFEVTPNAPFSVMKIIEELLDLHEPYLLEHFQECSIGSDIYAWLILRVLFTANFTTDEWKKIFDHVFTMPPMWMYYFLIAYLSYFKKPLLELQQRKDFEFFFQRKNACDVNRIIKKTYELMNKTEVEFPNYTEFMQLPEGHYPVFNKYPKHTVNYQLKARERILNEEMDIRKKKQAISELKSQSERSENSTATFLAKQRAMKEAESKIQKDIQEKEKELLQQQRRLNTERVTSQWEDRYKQEPEEEFNDLTSYFRRRGEEAEARYKNPTYMQFTTFKDDTFQIPSLRTNEARFHEGTDQGTNKVFHDTKSQTDIDRRQFQSSQLNQRNMQEDQSMLHRNQLNIHPTDSPTITKEKSMSADSEGEDLYNRITKEYKQQLEKKEQELQRLRKLLRQKEFEQLQKSKIDGLSSKIKSRDDEIAAIKRQLDDLQDQEVEIPDRPTEEFIRKSIEREKRLNLGKGSDIAKNDHSNDHFIPTTTEKQVETVKELKEKGVATESTSTEMGVETDQQQYNEITTQTNDELKPKNEQTDRIHKTELIVDSPHQLNRDEFDDQLIEIVQEKNDENDSTLKPSQEFSEKLDTDSEKRRNEISAPVRKPKKKIVRKKSKTYKKKPRTIPPHTLYVPKNAPTPEKRERQKAKDEFIRKKFEEFMAKRSESKPKRRESNSKKSFEKRKDFEWMNDLDDDDISISSSYSISSILRSPVQSHLAEIYDETDDAINELRKENENDRLLQYESYDYVPGGEKLTLYSPHTGLIRPPSLPEDSSISITTLPSLTSSRDLKQTESTYGSSLAPLTESSGKTLTDSSTNFQPFSSKGSDRTNEYLSEVTFQQSASDGKTDSDLTKKNSDFTTGSDTTFTISSSGTSGPPRPRKTIHQPTKKEQPSAEKPPIVPISLDRFIREHGNERPTKLKSASTSEIISSEDDHPS